MIGETLNHYRIVARIGRGGMGEVYAAEDTKLGRRVALKLLPADMAADEDRRARFEREAKAVAALNHPNIVTIYSVEQAGELHFITMELVCGKTLTKILHAGSLPLNQLLDHAVALTDAVTSAHRKGITHRDLKPDNVMLSDDGRLKVLDFGLSKLTEDPPSGAARTTVLPTRTVTQEGKILGTVAYMAPEQAQGKPTDARSDVFTLGVILYEMATGQRPFKGDTSISTITSILRDTPKSITELNRSLPRHFARIVRRCLEKDPELRYQGAQDLRNDLQGLRSELESGELQASDTVVAVAPARTRQTWLIAACAILAAAAVVVAWVQLSGRRAERAAEVPGAGARNMEIQRLTASGDSQEAIISADGRYVVYVVREAGRFSMWVMQVSTASKVEILPAAEATLWDPTFSPDGDTIYFCRYEDPGPSRLYQVASLGGSPRKVVEHVNGRVSFSPDGRRFVFLRIDLDGERSNLVVSGIDGNDQRVIATAGAPSRFDDPVWSPDGKAIAVARTTFDEGVQATVGTLAVDGGEWAALTDQSWLGVGEIAWLPDASGLVITAENENSAAQLWELSYPDGRAGRLTNDLNSYHGASLTADGQTLATVLNESTFNLWIVALAEGAAPVRLTSGKTNDGQGVDWTPDGRIVFGSDSGGKLSLWIVDADGENRAQLTREALNIVPRVTPDGRHVVFMSNRAGTVNLWRMDLDGGNPLRLTSGSLDVDPALTPDGSWVVYLDPGSGKLLRVPIDGGEPVEIRAARGDSGQVSPDGKWIVTGGFAEEAGLQAEVIPFEGGAPIATFHETDTALYGWTPAGDLCYVKTENGVDNLWTRPLEGGAAVQWTRFDADSIQAYAWSHDGKRLVVARGDVDSDIVLLRNFR